SIAICGECDRHLVGTAEFTYRLKSGRDRFYPHYYKCPHAGCQKVQRRMADVDGLVNGVVVGVLERDGIRLLGGDPGAATSARDRIEALEAKLALAADQFAEDILSGDQLARITGRLRPQLSAERERLAQAQPTTEMSAYAGANVAEAWGAADIETRKRILRLLGVRIVVNRIGPGNAREFDPQSVTISWPRGGAG
ncbi:MAG: hypothetical protein ACRCYU_11325, partial [Nocardioides sp.]